MVFSSKFTTTTTATTRVHVSLFCIDIKLSPVGDLFIVDIFLLLTNIANLGNNTPEYPEDYLYTIYIFICI